MKVRIVKCSNSDIWYRTKIGEVFEVCNWTDDAYLVEPDKLKLIYKKDTCRIASKKCESHLYPCGKDWLKGMEINNVNHPSHYTSHPSGVECIEITQHHDFCIGNAIKYLWRAGLKKEEGLTDKEKEIEDLKKALFYINKKINLLEK